MSLILSLDKNLLNYIKLLRPYKWSKNVFIFAALFFSLNLTDISLLWTSFVTFLVFCMYSSFVYILNDIYDSKQDALHPEKKYRPIASGVIKPKSALIFSIVILLLTTIIATIFLNTNTLVIFATYIIMNFIYSIRLKQEFLIDIFIIAIGFVLRILVGAFAINVTASPWLILSAFILALFLALSKRYHEVILLNGNSNTRKSLNSYTKELTAQLMTVLSVLVIATYIFYTFNSDYKNMLLTIPFVIYGTLRYLYLVNLNEMSGEPELILFKDKSFLINLVLWLVSVYLFVYIY